MTLGKFIMVGVAMASAIMANAADLTAKEVGPPSVVAALHFEVKSDKMSSYEK